MPPPKSVDHKDQQLNTTISSAMGAVANFLRILEVGRSCLAQPNDLQGCRSLFNHSDCGCGSFREVELTPSYERASIVNAHDHGAACYGIGHLKPSAKWQSSARGSKPMLIESLSRGRSATG
jgi:hypothetical protein